jgi:hypothetical protein
MFEALQVLTVVLVAVVMTPTLAHALELPGKLRLRKEEYLTVQPIYYPGFTIAGAAEPVGVLVLLLLVLVTPIGTAAFWLTLGSFVALLVAHLLYWVLTHPVNNFWLADFKLKDAGAGFFKFDPFGRSKPGERLATLDWTVLRDRWEYSHVARAVLATLSLILIATAAVV